MLLGGPSGGNPAQRRPGRSRVPHVARTLELPHDAARRIHDRAQPRPVREDRWLPARRRAGARRSTTAGSTGRGSCRPVTRSRRPAATSIPRCSSGSRPDIMPLSVEEGIANGVPEVRKAVRYQIKYGARLIKISASGGVMSHSGRGGRAAVLRRGARRDRRRSPPRRAQGRRARARRRRHQGVHPRRGRLHRARFARERRHHPDDGRPRHVPRADELPVRGTRRLAGRPGAAGEGGRGVPRAHARCSARRSPRA